MINKRALFLFVCGVGVSAAFAVVPEDSRLQADTDQQLFLLNPLLSPEDIPNTAAWRMEGARAVPVAEPTPKLGSHALRFEGTSLINGGKGDFTLVRSLEGELTAAGLWVYLGPDANVSRLGFQVYDAEGEALMYTQTADWEGWRWVEFDLEADEVTQAYRQPDKNGVLDQPVRGLNFFWFSRQEGLSTVVVDGLVGRARVDSREHEVETALYGLPYAEPGERVTAAVLTVNFADAPRTVNIDYRLATDANLTAIPKPHPRHGLDRAEGRPSWLKVNAKRIDNATMTDGQIYTGVNQQIADGYTEAFHYIDLGETLRISHMDFHAGDANWIWKMDVQASVDGQTFVPVEGLQNVPMHHRWAAQTINIPAPFEARVVRLRYHRDGEKLTWLRTPVVFRLYDEARPADFTLPTHGRALAEGTLEVVVPARSFAWTALPAVELEEGAYLLAARAQHGTYTALMTRSLFTMPPVLATLSEDSPFGINSSSFELFDINRRLGAPWVRFENMKWQMYCNAPDHFAFDGSIGPWHVRHDLFVQEYRDRGMFILPYTFQTPAWATSAPDDVDRNRHSWPPNDYADYDEAIYQLVARYGSRTVPAETLRTLDRRTGANQISVYQLWNEPNLVGPTWAPWVGSMDEYYEIFRHGAEGARRADPDARVSHAGYAGIAVDLVDTLRTYTYSDGKTPLDFTDLITVHYYSGRQDPEVATRDPNANRTGVPIEGLPTFPEQMRELTDWRDRFAPDKEVWITETGYDVGGPIGLGEREQAMKLPRVILLQLAAGVDKVFVYREQGSRPAMHAGAGLVRDDATLRPSFFTYATLIRQFEGVTPGRALRLLTEDPNVWIYLWERNGQPLLTAWTVSDTAEVNVGAATVTDSFGATHTVPTGETVPLTTFPRYIVPETLLPAWQEAKVAAQDREQAHQARLQRDRQRRTYLFDFGSAEDVASLTLGEVRRFTPVLAEHIYSPERGYGFEPAAMSDHQQHWIPDRLRRSHTRMNTSHTFRFDAQPGRYQLSITAAPFGDAVNLRIEAGDEAQVITVRPDAPRQPGIGEAELNITAGPVIIRTEALVNLYGLSLIEME